MRVKYLIIGLDFLTCTRHIHKLLKTLTTYLLIAILVVPSCKCKKDCDIPTSPECKNYDPCYYDQQPSAGFKVREQAYPPYGEYAQPDPRDTFYSTLVEFIADYDDRDAEYHWKIWNSSYDYTKQSFTLDFIDHFSNHPEDIDKPFPVTLTVIPKNPNPCHPEYTDTLVQTRYITCTNNRYYRDFQYRGTFSSDPGVEHDLVFYNKDPDSLFPVNRLFYIPNITKDTVKIRNSHLGSVNGSMRYSAFQFWLDFKPELEFELFSSWIKRFQGLAEFRANTYFSPDGHHRIHIDYWFTTDAVHFEHITFEGRAI